MAAYEGCMMKVMAAYEGCMMKVMAAYEGCMMKVIMVRGCRTLVNINFIKFYVLILIFAIRA